MATRKQGKRLRLISTLLILAGAMVIVAVLEIMPWFAQLERATFDFIFKVRPRRPPSQEIVIVAIDESSVREIGALPWPRSLHGELLRRLKQGGARVAVFDVLFDLETDPEEDAAFARAIREFGTVVLGRDLSITSDPQFNLRQTIDPLPLFLDAGATAGFVYTPYDVDTKIRRACWLVNEEPSLAVQGLSAMTGESPRRRDGGLYLGDRRVPADDTFGVPTFLINFAGPSHTIPTRSYYQVLDGTLPPGFLKNKIVFVGADLAAENRTGGPGVDRFPTPVDEEVLMPGVEIHANALNTILTRSFLRTAPVGVIWSVLLLVAVIATWLTLAFRPLAAGLTVLVMSVAAGVVCYTIFVRYDYWLPPVRAIALITLIYGGNTLTQYRLALMERAHIQKAFRHYVSAQVLDELARDPDQLGLGGREAEATVVFTDIAGFSKIAEKISPQELTAMLNRYFELLASIIMKENGMVNKFIGDAVMAIWGVPLENPRHAVEACRASLLMRRGMVSMAPVTCRIGVNTGRMIAGNMGSRERFEYTVIGDAVNLASRLEGVNKHYGTDAMISEMTEEKVRGHFLVREVDLIRVVGKEKPVRIYQLLDMIENREAPEHQRWSEMIESFMPVLESYRRQDWTNAASVLERHRTLFPEDTVAGVYGERIREFSVTPPPAGWDGVYSMESK